MVWTSRQHCTARLGAAVLSDISIEIATTLTAKKPSKCWRPTVIPTGGEDSDSRLINYPVEEFKKIRVSICATIRWRCSV